MYCSNVEERLCVRVQIWDSFSREGTVKPMVFVGTGLVTI